MKKIAFYGKAAKLVELSMFEELLSVLDQTWDEPARFFFAQDLSERMRKDFPSLATRYLDEPDRIYTDELPDGTDLLVCLGGDGTMLDTLHLVKDTSVPVLGINFGRLGFLNALNADGIKTYLKPGFFNRFRRENRLILEADEFDFYGEQENENPFAFPYALNEVTVYKNDASPLVLLDVFVDGSFMNTYYGDGVLFSTPTGSTAYSLSCGGPILIPSADNILITPIASHTLTVRPIILEGYQEILVKTRGGKGCRVMLDSAMVEIEGPFSFKIHKAGFKFINIYPAERNFFDVIREKLMWGVDIRHK